jgi:hypothetical protein
VGCAASASVSVIVTPLSPDALTAANPPPHHRPPRASRTGPEGRPCTRVFGFVHTAHAAPAFGVGVRGSRSRPTGTRTGASAATVKRRASRRRSCSAAPPASTPVTRFQSGGSPSSVERVDVIGSSFPLGATSTRPQPLYCQYLPRALLCEPLVTWLFANALVIAAGATQYSSDRRPDTPVDTENRRWRAGGAPGSRARLPPGSGDDRPSRPAE